MTNLCTNFEVSIYHTSVMFCDVLFGAAPSLHIGLPVRLFKLASGEVSLTILTSNNVGEYHRVFYNYPGPKNEQCHTQTV